MSKLEIIKLLRLIPTKLMNCEIVKICTTNDSGPKLHVNIVFIHYATAIR